MAGREELDRRRSLHAKCKSLSKTTWNHHERRQNNSVENAFQRFALSFVSFLRRKHNFRPNVFYYYMTNTLQRTQNFNLWFQPENSRFEVRDHSSRTSWHAQWLSCCKNTSGWRPWYQESLVLKFPNYDWHHSYFARCPDPFQLPLQDLLVLNFLSLSLSLSFTRMSNGQATSIIRHLRSISIQYRNIRLVVFNLVVSLYFEVPHAQHLHAAPCTEIYAKIWRQEKRQQVHSTIPWELCECCTR